MKITELLKNSNARIVNGDKWLVYMAGEWTVFYHTYGAKTNKCLYRGAHLEKAISFMID